MIQMNKSILLGLFLVFLSTFAFADVISSPLDFAMPIGILAIMGTILLAIISAGIGIIYYLYIRLIKRTNLTKEQKEKYKKSSKKIIKIIAIVFIGFFVLTFLWIILTPPHGGRPNPIASGLKSTAPSGIGTTQEFLMNPSDEISAEDFQNNTGLDVNSIFFCKSNNLGSTGEMLIISSANNISSVKSIATTKIKLNAKIICKQTNLDTNHTLGLANFSCPGIIEYCGDTQPCCAIVLQKPNN